MSENIRKALENHLKNTPSGLIVAQTAWENAPFTPVTGTPYQKATMLYAAPDNLTMGCNYRREQGILQIDLCYPLNAGNSAAQSQADIIRERFKRGTTLSHGGVNVLIPRTPSKATIGRVDDRYVVSVSINYSAEIFG